MGNLGECCDRFGTRLEHYLQKSCRPLHNLFLSRKRQYRGIKAILGFIYGLLLGLGFYELILVDLNFTESAGLLLGGIISIMLGFGIAFSSQIRCISLLSIVSFCGKSGRGVLKALVLAYIISGPINNLTNNGKRSRESLCLFHIFNLQLNKNQVRTDVQTIRASAVRHESRLN